MRRLILFAILPFSLCFSACIADDTKLADLSASERERVCSRNNYEAVTCEDGKTYDAFTEAECIDTLESAAGSKCLTTVGDLEDIANDPCSEAADRARATFITCIF